jgi:hypothetical protein
MSQAIAAEGLKSEPSKNSQRMSKITHPAPEKYTVLGDMVILTTTVKQTTSMMDIK